MNKPCAICEAAAKVASDAFPSTWLDPLLSGDDAKIKKPNCPEVEALINALKTRIDTAIRQSCTHAVGAPELVGRLRSLKVLLGTDSPEVRGWAPAVRQSAQKVINAAIVAISAQSSSKPEGR